ncbi:MAG: dinitrogenase iron-molybdenum cofactor biosynthesis protein [Desulfovibrionaceae bacterium]|nr:dinitrogenase iron-molybdenum cofactor biosynthesis protein [Desulfovibrionaceae bacterium]
MKLCVTSTGNTLDAKADGSFGRAHYFIIIDTETLQFEAVVNSSADASQGAGIAAAQTISNLGVDGLLTGYVGPKALAALESTGIKIFEGVSVKDTVQDAVKKFTAGTFKEKDMNAPAAMGGQGKCGAGMGRGRGGGRGVGGGGGRGMGRGQGQRGNI